MNPRRNLCRKSGSQALPGAKVQGSRGRDVREVETREASAPDGGKPPDGVAARGSVSGRGPRAKRCGRDSPKGVPLRRLAAAGASVDHPGMYRKYRMEVGSDVQTLRKRRNIAEILRVCTKNLNGRSFFAYKPISHCLPYPNIDRPRYKSLRRCSKGTGREVCYIGK